MFQHWSFPLTLYSFEPTIVSDLGYAGNRAQLMSVPPFVTAFVCAWLFAVILGALILFNAIRLNDLRICVGPLPLSWVDDDILLRPGDHRIFHVLWFVFAGLAMSHS